MKTIAALLILAMVWFVGLLAFTSRVDQSTPAAEPPVSDGVVVLTGASNVRLEQATKLLEAGKGKRLLISGVNREVRRQELSALTPGSKRLFNCCVDLGFEAETTTGNAQEIAAWARARGYDHLIVVTSDYHMPRSLVEIRSAARGVQLTAPEISYANPLPGRPAAVAWSPIRAITNGTRVASS